MRAQVFFKPNNCRVSPFAHSFKIWPESLVQTLISILVSVLFSFFLQSVAVFLFRNKEFQTHAVGSISYVSLAVDVFRDQRNAMGSVLQYGINIMQYGINIMPHGI